MVILAYQKPAKYHRGLLCSVGLSSRRQNIVSCQLIPLTHRIAHSILMRMNSSDPNAATELDLKRLESQVDQLIQTIERLSDENRNLRGKQQELMSERAELIEKTELARNRVEAMISRLRAIETG